MALKKNCKVNFKIVHSLMCFTVAKQCWTVGFKSILIIIIIMILRRFRDFFPIWFYELRLI